jgi:predicted nucleotidyltransferase
MLSTTFYFNQIGTFVETGMNKELSHHYLSLASTKFQNKLEQRIFSRKTLFLLFCSKEGVFYGMYSFVYYILGEKPGCSQNK